MFTNGKEPAFDKHPGVIGRHKDDPTKVLYVALQEDEVMHSSVRMLNKRQLDEVVFFLNSYRHELPD